MRAGTLRDKVSIQLPGATTYDSYGAEVITYTTPLSSVWAAVEPLTMRESFMAQQAGAKAEIKVTLRHSSTSINPKMRLVYNSSYYDIHSVINVGNRDRAIELLCSKREPS